MALMCIIVTTDISLQTELSGKEYLKYFPTEILLECNWFELIYGLLLFGMFINSVSIFFFFAEMSAIYFKEKRVMANIYILRHNFYTQSLLL